MNRRKVNMINAMYTECSKIEIMPNIGHFPPQFVSETG